MHFQKVASENQARGSVASERETRNFDKPPVVEVVCGVQFAPLSGLQMAHVGSFWEKIRDKYPRCEDQPPLAAVIESYSPDGRRDLHVSSVPPLPRCWFISGDETSIIQVQRDRFHHNWRKVQTSDAYPRYDAVIKSYMSGLETFARFLSACEIGELSYQQYELTYVNHMPAGEGWANIDEIGNVFPDFGWRSEPKRFLPRPEGVRWKTSFRLPDQSGRLHATIQTGIHKDGKDFLLLELTVRGFPTSDSVDMREWFDEANRWIVCGFEDLTNETIRKNTWGQR